MSGIALLLAIVASAAIAPAGPHDLAARAAVQESLAQIHPRFRAEWLNRRGIKLPGYNAPLPAHDRPDSLGLRLVGKWGRGPSVEVTGTGDTVYLSLGSEVAIINFANPDSPAILAEVQASGLVVQAAVRDSFLYIGCNGGWAGIEVWNVRNPSAPLLRSRTATMLADFCIKDSFLYLIQNGYGPADTFRVYSTADPAALRPLGDCIDSGYAVTVTGSTVLVAGPDAIVAIDVSDPANPRRAGAYGGYALGLAARGNICCANIYWNTDDDHFRFEVLDVSNPASISRLGYVNNCGGYDVFLDGPLAFVSGFQSGGYELQIVTIADSTSPALISSTTTEGAGDGVWESAVLNRAFVADRHRGLSVIDIANLNAPRHDTTLLVADLAYDVSIDGGYCYVADYRGGMRVLDISVPTQPREVGGIDSVLGTSRAVVARDSFAFAGWYVPWLRSVDVTDPTRPTMAGGANTFGWPEAMVLRDSFIYCAEAYRFQVINVARPRQPVVVGTCNTEAMDWGGLVLRDTLAYVAFWPSDIINVADPAHPVKIGEFRRGADNIDVRDTFAYLVGGGLYVYSVANPASPVLIDSLCTGFQAWSIAVVDTLAYVGCRDAVRLMSVADPHNIRVLAASATPDLVWKLRHEAPFVYAACFGAGICILDTVTTGIVESRPARPPSPGVRPSGSLVRGLVTVKVSNSERKEVMCDAYNVAGARVPAAVTVATDAGSTSVWIDLRSEPAGVYLLMVRVGAAVHPLRITKL